jgi:hypothetical protein
MTSGTAYGSGNSTPERRGRRWLPFWVMQATEIGVAVVFADASIHVSNAHLLVVGALAFFALAVTAQGPLGIVRICGQSLHLILAVIAGVLVAIAPILPALRPDIEGIIVVEFGAIGLIRVATLTRSTSTPLGPKQTERSRGGATVIDTTATVVDVRTTSSAPRSDSQSSQSSQSSPSSPSSHPNPDSPPSSSAAARLAGRAAGAATASGKRAAAKYGPSATARIKQSIRTAGRIAGSATSSQADPKDRTS